MVSDLVSIMNGENDDPTDDYAYKLVYTGEDYPYSSEFEDGVALLAREAVEAGMGIRTGITETFNNHLNEIPAYGTTIAADGHLVRDESWELFGPNRIAASENECYTTCGFTSPDPEYAVKYSNLKVLQMGLNWLYVVPVDSHFDDLPEHWAWVRKELGHTVATAPDAWVALRHARDPYWEDRGDKSWTGFPYIRNLERWIVQRDVEPGGTTRRGNEFRENDPVPENGDAYESVQTDVANGQTRIHLDVDDRFLSTPATVDVLVTARGGAWSLEYRSTDGTTRTAPQVAAAPDFHTVTIRLPDSHFDDGLAGATDLALRADAGDLEASFVRVVKAGPAAEPQPEPVPGADAGADPGADPAAGHAVAGPRSPAGRAGPRARHAPPRRPSAPLHRRPVVQAPARRRRASNPAALLAERSRAGRDHASPRPQAGADDPPQRPHGSQLAEDQQPRAAARPLHGPHRRNRQGRPPLAGRHRDAPRHQRGPSRRPTVASRLSSRRRSRPPSTRSPTRSTRKRSGSRSATGSSRPARLRGSAADRASRCHPEHGPRGRTASARARPATRSSRRRRRSRSRTSSFTAASTLAPCCVPGASGTRWSRRPGSARRTSWRSRLSCGGERSRGRSASSSATSTPSASI